MIDTIVIAAAGRGTRMKEHTADKPKQMVEVCGKPFIAYVLSSVVAAGFERIILVSGYQADVMKQYLNAQQFSVEYVDQFVFSSTKYGTAMVVAAVESVVGNEAFILQSGDWVYTPDSYAALRICTETTVVTVEHEHPEQFGVIDSNANRILNQIIEKPSVATSNQINAAFYAFTSEIFPVVHTIQQSPRGEYELTDAINILATQKKVKTMPLQGNGIELGKPEDLAHVEEFIRTYNLR